MKNLKLELFNFKKTLSLDQEDVSKIVEGHMNACVEHSEKSIIRSLNEKLKPYTYDTSVKGLLENLNNDIRQHELLYNLKDLYNILNTKNQGELIRQPINVLLQIINLDSDQDRMSKILNDLAIYDWVPEIKLFVHNLTTSPEKRSNLMSGGNSETIYTVVEQVEGGHIALVKDSWFYLTDNEIEKALLETHIKDENKLNALRTVQTALQYSTIVDDRIDFKLSEYLTLGINVNNKNFYINGEELSGETTLDSVFSSPIVPIVNKNFYPVLKEVRDNIDKFVELDIVKRVTNLINPYLECYVFNYKNCVYLYRCDERYGNSFFKYESALELVNDIKNELNYDLTYFFENKMNKEIVKMKKLEDKEREISLKLEDVQFNIDKVKSSIDLMGGSDILSTALKNLESRKKNLNYELMGIKELKFNEKIKY